MHTRSTRSPQHRDSRTLYRALVLLFTAHYVLFAATDAVAPDIPMIVSVALQGTSRPVKLETQAGHPYDSFTIEHDVRRLWKTGRFDDVSVQKNDGPDGATVVFNVVEQPPLRLHQIVVEPDEQKVKMDVPEGSPISPFAAHQIALKAQHELIADGYVGATVDSELVPYSKDEVDVRLRVRAGDKPVRVTAVEFTGDTILTEKQLRGSLQALKIHHGALAFLPKPRYSDEAVDADVARLHSLYVSKGYFDALIRPDNVDVDGRDATVRIRIVAGQAYRVQSVTGLEASSNIRPAKWSSDLCSCLFKARREAEKKGIIDFHPHVDVREDSNVADLVTSVEEGEPFQVGHIEFSGLHSFKDESVRRNVVQEEAALLDAGLLRQSVARLNETAMFDPITMQDVLVKTDDKTGKADIVFRVRERKRGSWLLSGPVGPSSFAGPLEASLSSRLPPWGRGIFELSTYTVSLTAFAFMSPIVPALGVSKVASMVPVIALRRPYSPGEGWLSGFTIAPQLGWKLGVIGYATTQIQRRMLPLLDGSRSAQPELAIEFSTPRSSGPMLCDAPKPRFMMARRVGALTLELAGAFTAF